MKGGAGMTICNGCQYLGCMEMPNSWLYRCINNKGDKAKPILQVARKSNFKKIDVPIPAWCEKVGDSNAR